MDFALIKNGKIENIIVANYTAANKTATAQGMESCVDVTDWPVQAGDAWNGTAFLRDNKEVSRTRKDSTVSAEIGINTTDLMIENIILGQTITDLEIRLLTLEASHV